MSTASSQGLGPAQRGSGGQGSAGSPRPSLTLRFNRAKEAEDDLSDVIGVVGRRPGQQPSQLAGGFCRRRLQSAPSPCALLPSAMQPDVPLLLSTLPQLSTACFLIKFWATLPPGEQAYFGCLPAVFVAHIAWRWTAPRHYLAWRSLPAAFWVLEPLLPRPCWRGWALSTADNSLPLLAPGRSWVVRATGGTAVLLKPKRLGVMSETVSVHVCIC